MEHRRNTTGKMRASVSSAIARALDNRGEPMLVLSQPKHADTLLRLAEGMLERFSSQLRLTVDPHEGCGLCGIVIKADGRDQPQDPGDPVTNPQPDRPGQSLGRPAHHQQSPGSSLEEDER